MTSLGAIHEIEAINAAGLLPGVHLGYVMCDTCSHASKTLQSVEHMLSIHHSPAATCSYIDFRPRVKLFLGALHSEVAITLSRLLSVYMIPLVSNKYLKVFNIFILEMTKWLLQGAEMNDLQHKSCLRDGRLVKTVRNECSLVFFIQILQRNLILELEYRNKKLPSIILTPLLCFSFYLGQRENIRIL